MRQLAQKITTGPKKAQEKRRFNQAITERVAFCQDIDSKRDNTHVTGITNLERRWDFKSHIKKKGQRSMHQ